MLLFWIIVGLVLSGLELIIPGAVLIFVGMGALTSGALIYYGIINTWMSAFICWFITSIVYLLSLRTIAMKIFSGEESVQDTDEEAAAAGTIVDVSEEILPERPGRIKYLDSTWIAYAAEKIETGERVILVSRNGNGWNIKTLT